MIILLVATHFTKCNERFSLNRMNNYNNIHSKFCSKLRLLDKKNENILALKDLSDDMIKKNDNTIMNLRKQIENLEYDLYNHDINRKLNYKLKTHKDALKQIEVIKKAKENILNRNNVKVNII